ncbi:MAG: M6 family metalloprotease domain-containing protein, partial [Bacteroidales bacterium]|nr:M6 family metalloprotease domain-containing protein [Bacteroidales bacterium]
SLTLMAVYVANAVPAKPGYRTYTQPDGKTLVLEQKGDEFGSWFRDKSGNRYTMDGNGFFHPLTEVQARGIARRASARRAQANSLRSEIPFSDMTHGTRHIPVVLVEFSDVKFKTPSPASSFDALLNEAGYNGPDGVGASGSVRDFYLDNSHGAFEPIFDVFGPVTLDNPIKYYGEQVLNDDGTVKAPDKQPELILYDACLKLDDTVDFSKYDYNSDGLVDMFLFYYAGGSQAEGWPTDHIWPHSSNMMCSQNSDANSHKFDGKRLGRYFCSAELKGSTTVNFMCSIGVTCHEFGHSLGLPDFYDADYKENGENAGLYIFSTMCNGPYNDGARTPPYFNAEERIMLGWMDETDVKPVVAGDNRLPFIHENVALRINASVQGEYFFFEKRGGESNKWDRPLPEGMVAYHVDKSPSHLITGGVTAEQIWKTNHINNYGGHPCFTVVPPAAQEETADTHTQIDYSDLVFPGFYGIQSYCPLDYDGFQSDVMLTDIHLDGPDIVFSAQDVMCLLSLLRVTVHGNRLAALELRSGLR